MRSKVEAMWYGGKGPLWLAPLSFIYGAFMAVRGFLYRIGLRQRFRMKVPVVVVGNLTVGGTGKTPLVAWISMRLAAVGMRVAIVSRGYGGRARGVTRVTVHSRPSEVGDEPLLLARRSQATVFVGRDRVAAARKAVEDGADVVLCDDGLQHLALMRDCEIVVVDGQRGFGNGCLLPRGPLRERPGRLRRVNAVVVNGAISAPGFALPRLVTRTQFVMNMRPGDARPVSGGASLRSLSSFRATGVHAVAAIGNPQRFFDMLKSAGLTLYEHPMPDHHAFKSGDLNFGDNLPVLMTEKDAVKCVAFADERCWYVPVTAEFSENESRELLDLVLVRASSFKAPNKHG
ncbi:MAG TPA: tetraacyldisaccharide 4'-kinase [Steroidobacteraceae bacterium]|jgi:tetraacyldisaccharide 4'-kinase|nr:tetraacyldisaccharide 4'-kinase [Steroidobacteraceae bacterium]